MKLSKKEISTFFDIIQVNNNLRDTSLDFLNLIIEGVAKFIPWQNISMIENGLGKIPTFEDIKGNMLLGNGGICLDINRFMFYLLTEIGYDVQYILCGRINAEKRHIAIITYFNGNPYFIDFGDAQPYYKALNVHDNRIITRGTTEYQFQNKENEYQLLIKKNNEWNVSYVFNFQRYNEIDFASFIQKYYTDINYGPFWKAVHFAYYPNKKLRAIKGMTILVEKENGVICTLKHSNFEQFNISLKKYFDKDILVKFRFYENFIKLEEITQKNNMINTLKQFIAFETIANDEKANSQGIELVSDLLKSIGFSISIEGDSPFKQPVIIAKHTNKNSTKKVTLYSHYDVEKIHKEEKWNTDPFVLVEKDGRYYARGIADNKGVLLSRIFSLIELKKNDEELPNILWIIQGEEEVAGQTTFEVIPKHIEEFNSKIYVEETGVYQDNVPVIFHLPETKSRPDFIDDMNNAIYDGTAIYANRHLNKFTKCPFITNIPKDAYYVGFGPNDSLCNIHRDNESLSIEKLVKHNDVFKKFIKWINKTEI